MSISIDWKKTPLVPGIVQDAKTKQVLMLGYLSEESYELTKATGTATFFSRSRQRLWTKGEESGNYLKVVSIDTDCDSDSLLLSVEPIGPTCHTSRPSCFNQSELEALEHTILSRMSQQNESSYVYRLLTGEKKHLYKKIGEEATEVVVALAIQEKEDVIDEISDLVFHLTVGMHSRSISWADIYSSLEKRRSTKH